MACYHPIEVGILRKQVYGGRRRRDLQRVPCGTCLGCRAEQARQWSVRILHEMQMHDAAWFLTLTYSDEELPENGSLYPQDFREFIKAVRRDYPPQRISYYGCGEYGSFTQRPHYHAVLFGADFLDKRPLRTANGNPVWRSATLERYWPHGLSEFGTVTAASAAYVAGYVRKKITRSQDPDAYERVDDETGQLVQIEPEFARMSLKPALGRRWLEKYWQDVYPADMVVVDGFEGKPPRYYDKWLEEHQPEMAMLVRERRIQAADELSRYTLDAKEKIHQTRLDLFQPRNTI